MVQFRVLELTLSFSSQFTLPELNLYVTNLHIHHRAHTYHGVTDTVSLIGFTNGQL